jgi:Protein of unknown function (DUF1266)
MPNGTVAKLLGGAEAAKAYATNVAVRTSEQAWALATAAIIFTYNGKRSDTMTGEPATPDELGARTSALNDQQFAAVRSQLGQDPEVMNKLDVVRAHYLELGTKSILAWDLIRYISLCRWGVLAGYMFEADAWRQVMPAAQQLQQAFDSWQDLQKNYLIGREFWSLEQTRKSGARFQAAYDKLSTDPSSPWNTIPWNTPLDVRRPMSAAPGIGTRASRERRDRLDWLRSYWDLLQRSESES